MRRLRLVLMPKIKFTTYCAHRSGSNFLQRLIVDNFENCDYIERDHNKMGWKHQTYHEKYMKGKEFCLLIARHPVKWVNSCIRFNADMWKWWNVNQNESHGLSFMYRGRPVSIIKMVDKWNNFYGEWMEHSSCDIVWFADLLEDESRDRILYKIADKNNLRPKHENIVVPEKVQHSDEYNKDKRIQELNLYINDKLDILPHIREYVVDNIDYSLLNQIEQNKL